MNRAKGMRTFLVLQGLPFACCQNKFNVNRHWASSTEGPPSTFLAILQGLGAWLHALGRDRCVASINTIMKICKQKMQIFLLKNHLFSWCVCFSECISILSLTQTSNVLWCEGSHFFSVPGCFFGGYSFGCIFWDVCVCLVQLTWKIQWSEWVIKFTPGRTR